MESISVVLQELVGSYKYDVETLVTELGVSASTVNRWLSAESKPRPVVEGQLRNILTRLQRTRHVKDSPASYVMQQPLIETDTSVQEALDATLRELREILHRRARFSSRNEALDELCKVLFAHIMSIVDGAGGISREGVLGGREGTSGSASALKKFVHDAFDKYLPSSLSHEIHQHDFELRIKPQEDLLASEIIDCFERLAPKHGISNNAGMRDIDLLNDVFGKFLADSFADEKQLGQYLTPTEVVKFMVRLAIQDMSEPELDLLCSADQCTEFGLILDPSCGTASFLTELLRTLYGEVVDRHGMESARNWLEVMVRDVIVGIDKSERMIKLALTSMAMFGLPTAKLHLANSLARFGSDSDLTVSLHGKVRLILTNPPFGAEFEGKDLSAYKIATTWSRRSPTSVVSEVLLLERYLDWLAPAGQCLAIVPDSILTNKGLYEDLRKNLADKIEIRSVISLPPVTFGAAGTNTKTSVLHFRKSPSGSSRKATFFAICSDIGYNVATREAQRAKITNGTGELPKILEELSAPNSQLTLGRLVAHVEESGRWDANYHASLSPEIEQRINHPSASDMFVSDVAELSTERTDPRRWGTGTFEYIEISDVDAQTCMVHPKTVPCSEAPSRARKLVRTGDVLFSTVRPERRTVGVVREDQDGAVCTTGFAVLRPQKIDPMTLAYLLKSDFVIAQVLRCNIGIAYPAIDESCLLDVLIPVRQEDLALLNTHAEAILSLEKQIHSMRGEFSRAVGQAIKSGLACTSPGSRPRQSKQTIFHHQSCTEDSDGHIAWET